MGSTVKRVHKLGKPYWFKLSLAFIMLTAVHLARLIIPRITASIVNDVITDGQYDRLYPLCGAMLGLTLLRAILNYLRPMTFEHVSQQINIDLREGLYKHLQEMPWEFYDKNRVGEIMSRMTGDLNNVRNFFAACLNSIYQTVFNFAGSIVFMSFMSWQVTLIVLVITPLVAWFAASFRKKIRTVFVDIREQNAVLNTRVQENLAGMHVVKAFAREDYEIENFKRDNRLLLEKNLKATWIWSNLMPILNMISTLCTPICLLGSALMVKAGRMDIGTLVGVTGYIWTLISPMQQVAGIINTTTQAMTRAEKLFYYQDLGASIKEPEDAVEPAKYEGHVVFDHVTFAYTDRPVLKDICLDVKPGETVAIMGATGSGKSPLVTLLGRFYDVTSGSIRIDGIDIRRQKLQSLRKHIGFVMQDTFLFSDTIRDNIRYGIPDASDEDVRNAADVAQADEFIKDCPQGYETVVGERGMGLSGGQKQRTSIARAVLTNPAILILDDSTSAVDMETEFEIQQKLKSVLKNRTTFIIAHRISSVKNADQIIILKDGEIVERGTHSELLEKNGSYAGMVSDQMSSAVKV